MGCRGRRVDEVHFHPAWHQLMSLGFSYGLHCSAWSGRPMHTWAGRRISFFMVRRKPNLCPITMTSAALPLLRHQPALASFTEKMSQRDYDEHDIAWPDKTAVMVGMGLTEKQGGSICAA